MLFISLSLLLLVLYRIYQFSLTSLHILQLESYENDRYLSFVNKNILFWDYKTTILLTSYFILIELSEICCKIISQTAFKFVLTVLIFILLIILIKKEKNPLKKMDVIKPLVLTNRAKRILVTNIVLQIIFIMGIFFLCAGYPFKIPDLNYVFILLTVLLLKSSPYTMYLSNFLVFYLWEIHAQRRFITDAKEILAKIDPTVIAITGSYGKTSTKHITHQILSMRLPVLVTPGSFNTDMGICKTIRDSLRDNHEYFLVEMGAYRIGSIKRLCDFTPPKIGILTSIGVSHLERFGSQENVLKAKRELLEALPPDGLAIVNGDDMLCREAAKVSKAPVRFFGLNTSKNNLVVWASNLKYTNDGMVFDLKIKDSVINNVTSPLLGEHNLMNILAGVVCADYLGIESDVIKRGISQLTPIPHRMVITKDQNGVTIIDDSYNSNPRGFESALTILDKLPGRKILITPGIVELGKASDKVHIQLSESIMKTCDVVFIIENPDSKTLGNALKAKKNKLKNLNFFPDLASAKAELSKILTSGDIVLFENDLPDNYFRRR